MRKYIITTLVTLLIGVASAASGIYMYRTTQPKPIRVMIGVVCPRCLNRGPVRKYTKAEGGATSQLKQVLQ